MSIRFALDEVFALAQRIESNGARFYRRAAARCAEPELRARLLELADWEGGHERLFERLRAQIVTDGQQKSTVWDPEGELALYLDAMAEMHVFRDDLDLDALLEGAGDARGILRLALGFERDSIAFFTGMKALVLDAEARAGVERLIEEELGHVAHLARLRATLR